MVNNWHTSIAHPYGRVRHNAARAASFLKPPSRRREKIVLFARIHTFSRNLSNWANPPLVANIKDCNLCTLLRTRQLAHSTESAVNNRWRTLSHQNVATSHQNVATCSLLRTGSDKQLDRPEKKTFKKYTPTPIARELFPNFISDVGEVSRPELFEQFCVPIKNSWLLFSWNYLRKSKNWMSFEDLECGVRRPANLHLPLKSYVGHWVINIF